MEDGSADDIRKYFNANRVDNGNKKSTMNSPPLANGPAQYLTHKHKIDYPEYYGPEYKPSDLADAPGMTCLELLGSPSLSALDSINMKITELEQKGKNPSTFKQHKKQMERAFERVKKAKIGLQDAL